MVTKSDNTKYEDAFDFPWEDSLILAFRDMQWRLRIDSIFEDIISGKIKSADTLYPPPIFKLDGNAETSSADILTLLDKRFFLFEFKSTREKTISDAQKPIWNFFENIDCEDISNDKFITLSRKCHHFVYATFDKIQKKHCEVRSQFGALKSIIYYDEVVKNQPILMKNKQLGIISDIVEYIKKPPKNSTSYDIQVHQKRLEAEKKNLEGIIVDSLTKLERENTALAKRQLPTNETSTFSMMKDDNYGNCPVDMFAYLVLLKEITSRDKETPIKCVLSTQDGIVWPLFSLNDISLACNVFHEIFKNDSDLKSRCDARMADFSDFKKKYIQNPLKNN